MDNFAQHKEDDDTWYSTPFYSGPQGYKMRLQVDANGDGSGAGTHVSVYVQIIQGEYDDTLTWPYTKTVDFEIINWKDARHHVQRTVDFSRGSGRCNNKPTEEEGNKGWGQSKALPHNQLRGEDNQYINDDTLYIKVSNIAV